MSEEKNKPYRADCAGNFYDGTGCGTCVKCMHQNPALDDHTDDDSDDYEDDDYFEDVIDLDSLTDDSRPECRRCGGRANKSKGYGNALSPPGSFGKQTIWEGRGDLIPCWKCEKCGHSWT